MGRHWLRVGQDFLKLPVVSERVPFPASPQIGKRRRSNTCIARPVTASKSRACREGHTSGPCRWLFSAARPVGDVKSLKALHRYNVVKAPAFAKATAWQAKDEHARAGAARVGGNAARVAGTSAGEGSDQCAGPGISYEQ